MTMWWIMIILFFVIVDNTVGYEQSKKERVPPEWFNADG